jgi:hypothetical protein
MPFAKAAWRSGLGSLDGECCGCGCAGKSGYWAVIFFQQLASIGNNLTIQIVAGQSMKACML